MTPAKKVGITLQAGAIITIVGLILTMLWRLETKASAEKTAAKAQTKTDTQQNMRLDSNTIDIVGQRQIHREDVAEARRER